jgi:hypothetical protein
VIAPIRTHVRSSIWIILTADGGGTPSLKPFDRKALSAEIHRHSKQNRSTCVDVSGESSLANAPRRRPSTVVTMPTADSNVLENQSANTPDQEIAHRACELYCDRGCQHGHGLDDWSQAERELRDSVRRHIA